MSKGENVSILAEVSLSIMLLSVIIPSNYSKYLTVFAFIFFIIVIINERFIVSNLSFLNLGFFIPSMILIGLSKPIELVRFVPLSILILCYPKNLFFVYGRLLKNISFFMIVYLIISQFYLAIGNSFWTELRDVYYPINENPFNYGLLTESEAEFTFRSFRAGGIFYNPNVLGLVLLLLYIIFNKFSNSKSLKSLILFFIFISIIFTGSRTALGGLFLFYLFTNVKFNFLYIFYKYGRINRINFYTILFISPIFFLFFFYFFSFFIEAFSGATDGSGFIKLKILYNFISQSDVLTLLFGGHYGTQFDNEHGNWIGFSGFIGFIGIIILYFRFNYARADKITSLVLFVIGLGNTTFFGLLTSVILVVLFLSKKRNLNIVADH